MNIAKVDKKNEQKRPKHSKTKPELLNYRRFRFTQLRFIQFPTTFSHLKRIDKFNEYIVSAFVTASGIRFLVLHDKHNDDAIRHFFIEVYEAFIKQSMNPMYKHGEKIYSVRFNHKVEAIGKRYFS